MHAVPLKRGVDEGHGAIGTLIAEILADKFDKV